MAPVWDSGLALEREQARAWPLALVARRRSVSVQEPAQEQARSYSRFAHWNQEMILAVGSWRNCPGEEVAVAEQ